MVQPAGPGVKARGRKLEDSGHLLDTVKDPVAEADDPDVREAGRGLGQFRQRIGVVDEPRIRAVGFDGACDIYGRTHIAEGVEEAAWSAVLAVDLAEAEGAGDVEVLRPVEVAVDFDGQDDGIGAGQGVGKPGRDRYGGGPVQAVRDRFGVGLRAWQACRVDVDQGDLDAAVAQGVAEQDVADGSGAEFAAAGAYEDDLHGTAASWVSWSARRPVKTPAAMDTPRRITPAPARPVSMQPTPSRLPYTNSEPRAKPVHMRLAGGSAETIPVRRATGAHHPPGRTRRWNRSSTSSSSGFVTLITISQRRVHAMRITTARTRSISGA